MSEQIPTAGLTLHNSESVDISNGTSQRNNRLSRALLAGALIVTPTAATVANTTAAEAAVVNCFGDYCTGQYADDTNCDEDARTLSSTVLSNSGGSLEVTAGPVSASSEADSGAVGVVELRWSDICGTAWARLRTFRNNEVNFLGIEKNDGYYLQLPTSGDIPGSPAGNWFTPMVYGRGEDDQFRAYVFTQGFLDITPDNIGTYWMGPGETTEGAS